MKILPPDISWMLLPLEICFNVWCTCWPFDANGGTKERDETCLGSFPRRLGGIQLFSHSTEDDTSWSNVTNALIKIKLHRWWQLKDFWIFYPYILGEMIKFDDHIVLRWVVQPPTSRFFLCRLFCRLSMESVSVHWNPLKAPFDSLNKNTVTSHKFHGYSAYVDETLNQKGDLCKT